MKKQYIKPNASVVTLNLMGSVLQTLRLETASNPTDRFGAREMKYSDWDDNDDEEVVVTRGWSAM